MANKYSLQVSSRFLKPFMRHHGNNVCQDERTDKNIMLSLILSGDEDITTAVYKTVHTVNGDRSKTAIKMKL